MVGWIGGLFSLLGTGVQTFFGFKKHQAETVQSALEVVADVNSSNTQREQAVAKVIAAEASSGYWLTSNWRPLIMVFFAILIGARWFGYTPPNMTEAELLEVYSLIKLGIGGYIPARTIEKIISSVSIGKALNGYINKKFG